MSEPIYQIIDELPESGVTVMALRALDWVAPGEWQNLVGFENTIRAVTGESDEAIVQAVGERAIALYEDESQGYQRAVSIYRLVSTGSGVLGAAAMASKVGESISFLSFLDRVTPKAETTQAIDFGVKIAGELAAFTQINGIPGDSIGEFAGALADYTGESAMRVSAMIAFDAMLPLGPDFLLKVGETLGSLDAGSLIDNPVFSRIADYIPGGGPDGQLGFINRTFGSVSGWMGDFVASRGITPERVLENLRSFVEIGDESLDYVSAFLDMTVNYYEHTGVQTVARRLVERAVAEI